MRDLVHGSSVHDRRCQERTIWRTALLVSALLHVLVFAGWRGRVIPTSPFSAAGPRAGDDRAAPGGMQAMNLQAAARIVVPKPPVPIVAKVDVKPVEFEDSIPMDVASILGANPGDLLAGGLPGGTGRGGGGTATEGRYKLDPPSPRGMIIPPAKKGTTVEVWVYVDKQGNVVPDSTRLNPPTSDGDFNKRLIREAAEWVFKPAHRGDQAVGSWFSYKISM